MKLHPMLSQKDFTKLSVMNLRMETYNPQFSYLATVIIVQTTRLQMKKREMLFAFLKSKYCNSPIYEPSSCKLPKMQMCIRMSKHEIQFTYLEYVIMCMHPLQVVVLLCILVSSIVQRTVVEYLYSKPGMSRSKYKSSDDAQYYTLQDILFSSVAQQCLTLCDPMACSMPGLSVYHQLLKFTQIHVH